MKFRFPAPSRLGCALALAASLCLSARNASAQAPSINVAFSNVTQNERSSDDIWINLSSGGAPSLDSSTGVVTYSATDAIGTANLWNGTAFEQSNIYTNTAYKLSDIQNGTMQIAGFGGGRAYISYGQALTNLATTPRMGPYAGWQPAPAVPDPNFQIRYQAVELTVQQSVVNTAGTYSFTGTNQIYADLSYIDSTAISTGIQVNNAPPGTTNPVLQSANTSALVNAVYGTIPGGPTDATTNIVTSGTYIPQPGGTPVPIVQVPGEQSPAPAPPATPYSNTVTFPTPSTPLVSGNFLRVAGPGQMPTVGNASGPTSFYHSWSPYLTAMQTGGALNPTGTSTQLAGTYGPANTSATPYTGTAEFRAGTITINTNGQDVEYTGYVHIVFTYDGVTYTVDIPYSELEASTGVYGANPAYSINGGPMVTVPGNTVETRVAGDVVAGMNFGFVGSAVTVDGYGVIGQLTSEQWWEIGLLNDGQYLYGGAQTNSDYYNTYAAALQPLTDAYGFALGDRLGNNTTEFNRTAGDGYDDATLVFLIQPDFATVPEPSTWLLLGLGAVVLGVVIRRRELAAR